MAYDLTMGGLYAVIPAGVLYDDRLRPAAKLLYGEIVRLAQSSGYCYATNKQLMGVCNLTDKSVSELVSQLRDCGHIRVEIPPPKNRERVSRKIRRNIKVLRIQVYIPL